MTSKYALIRGCRFLIGVYIRWTVPFTMQISRRGGCKRWMECPFWIVVSKFSVCVWGAVCVCGDSNFLDAVLSQTAHVNKPATDISPLDFRVGGRSRQSTKINFCPTTVFTSSLIITPPSHLPNHLNSPLNPHNVDPEFIAFDTHCHCRTFPISIQLFNCLSGD